MATWKRIEREIAKRVNGQRVGNTGKDTPDVIGSGGYLICEVKHRAKLPDWLKGALIQAETHAESDQLAVAILHEKRMIIDDSLVILRLDDFIRWWQ